MINVLSRRSQLMHVSYINNLNFDLKTKLQEALKVDNHYLQVVAIFQARNKPLKIFNYALVEDEILQFDSRVYIPVESEINKMILHEMHNVPYADHLGSEKTLTTFKKE